MAAATPGAPNGGTVVTPDADDDGDGATNAEEVIAGTDPTDASDYLHATEVVRGAAGNTLTWTSVVGKTYDIEYSLTLESNAWQVISTAPLTADGLTSVFTDTDAVRSSAQIGFYRARVSN